MCSRQSVYLTESHAEAVTVAHFSRHAHAIKVFVITVVYLATLLDKRYGCLVTPVPVHVDFNLHFHWNSSVSAAGSGIPCGHVMAQS
jgi:hypothetical protein